MRPERAPAQEAPTEGGTAASLHLELSLAGLTVAGVVGLARLFDDLSFLPACLVFGLLGHALAALCRRRALGAPATTAVALLGALAAVSWVVLPGTTVLGVPTPTTLTTALARLGDGWRVFTDVSAPAPAAAGLVLASALGTYLVAWVADGAAFRAGALVEAAVPASSLFVFGAALGAAAFRIPSTLLFLAALLAYWLLARARRTSRASAVGDETGAGTSALSAGARLGGVAAVAAVLIGPLLPGAGANALLPWRASDRDDDGRVTVSPLVDIQARIVEQSDAEAFTVESDARSYWRLTALDSFDGRVWRSQARFTDASDQLGEVGEVEPGDGRRLISQDVDVVALDSIWLPAAFSPVALDAGDEDVGVDPNNGTLVTQGDTSNGLRYRVESAVRDHTPETLRAAAGQADLAPGRAVVARYTDLPGDFSRRVRQLAESLTAGQSTPYDQARVLQDWFRNGEFLYDLTIEPGHGEDELERFLFTTRTGYCEQFAGAYAAMARAAGLPTRIAVGFTPGELRPDNRYHVRGVHGHAWPEVLLGDAGWVAFEPTPGRGIPGAEPYTGVEAAQAGSDGVGPTTTLATTTTTPGSTTAPSQPQRPLDRLPETLPGGGATDDGSPWPGRLATAGVVVAVAAVLWVLAMVAALQWRRRRRRALAADPSERVLVAWAEVTEALARAGAARRPAETPEEYARRIGRSLGSTEEARLGALGAAATEAGYAEAPLDDPWAAEVVADAATIERSVLATLDRRERLVAALDPRPLLPRRERVDIRTAQA